MLAGCSLLERPLEARIAREWGAPLCLLALTLASPSKPGKHVKPRRNQTKARSDGDRACHDDDDDDDDEGHDDHDDD